MFRRHPLIFRRSKSAPRWQRLGDCVWEGVKALKSRFALAQPYARFEELFRQILEVPDASAEMLVEELRSESRTRFDHSVDEQVQQVTALLTGLNDFARRSTGLPKEVSRSLLTLTCWPCCLEGSTVIVFVSCETEFFINDRRDIAELFGNQISMLQLSVEAVSALNRLLKALMLDDRRLSESTKVETRSCGPQRLDESQTKSLRMKSEALLRYAPSPSISLPMTDTGQLRDLQEEAH